jgi:transcriptional regulator with XRE-family HTH domain
MAKTKELKRKLKVTGKEIAELLGVTEKTVSTWKNSDRNEDQLKYQLIKTGLMVRKLGLKQRDLLKLKEEIGKD